MSMNEQFGSALRLSEVQDFFNKDNILKLKSLLTEQTDPPQYNLLSSTVKTKWKASIKELYQYTNVSDQIAKDIWDNPEGIASYTQAKTAFWNKLNGINTTKAGSNDTININQEIQNQGNSYTGGSGEGEEEEEAEGWFNFGWEIWTIIVLAVGFLFLLGTMAAGKVITGGSRVAKAFQWIFQKVGLPISRFINRGAKAFWGWMVRNRWNPIVKRDNDGIRQFFQSDIDTMIDKFKNESNAFEAEVVELLRLAKNPTVYTRTLKEGVPHLVNMFKAGIIDKHVIKQYVSPAMWNKMKPKVNAFIKDTNARLSAKNGKPSDHWANAIKGKSVGL